MILKTLKVYKYETSGKLIAGPVGDNFFLPINSDLTLASKKAHKIKWNTKFFDTPYKIEIESRFVNDINECRIVRVWDERHLPEKSNDPSEALEKRIDISPSNLMNEAEKQYVGASNGHVSGKICYGAGFITIWFTGISYWFLFIALTLFYVGYSITKSTTTKGDPDKIREVEEAKIRIRAHAEKLIQQAMNDVRAWELLDGIGFENAVSKIFRSNGYEVKHTPRSNDKGVDLILTKPGEKIIVQCKTHSKTIGSSPLRELNGIKPEWPDATKFMLVCLYEFSNEAKIFAKNHDIELFSITRDHLKTEFQSNR